MLNDESDPDVTTEQFHLSFSEDAGVGTPATGASRIGVPSAACATEPGLISLACRAVCISAMGKALARSASPTSDGPAL